MQIFIFTKVDDEKYIYIPFGLTAAICTYGSAEEVQEIKPHKPETALSYFFDTSFIYWYAKEDGLDLGKSAVLGNVGRIFPQPDTKMLKQSFEYSPGFKIGTGLQGQEWGFNAEYTWLGSNPNTSQTAPSNESNITGTGVWNVSDWFLQSSSFNQSPASVQINSDWHLGLNELDLLSSYSILSKKSISLTGFIGLKSTWIYQRLNVYLPGGITTITVPTGRIYIPPHSVSSSNRSNSWGIGPKAGLNTKYILSKGFRLEGLVAASLLYTRFTSVKHKETLIFEGALDNPLFSNSRQFSMSVSEGAYSTVRPVLETNLGFGWRTGLYENRYSIDLSAHYDFSYFWGQNVMREMMDQFALGSGGSPGDLYFQGLTLTASFGF